MDTATVFDLVGALAEVATRLEAAARVAHFVGSEAMLALVHDREVDRLIPALGFPKTLVGGANWSQFLDGAQRAARHRGVVGYPTVADEAQAASWRIGTTVFVFIGGTIDEGRASLALSALRLSAALFPAEYEAAATRGELKAAQDYARQAETLTKALEAARAEVAHRMAEVRVHTRALIEAKAKSEEAARTKDEFLAMLGHELRNPLAPIVTALELLRLKNMWSREHEVIERQVANMMRLVDDLLDVSRITRGRIELRREVEELSTIVADSVQTASGALQRKRQCLRVSVQRSGLRIDGDRARLIQVITNLLTNASKYSDPETTIEIAAERRAGLIRISVSDQGIGLAPEMLTRVFELFIQSSQALDRAQGGLGLGLAIVRSLVDLHGGRVWAESAGVGRGSTFFIELPLSRAPLPSAASQSPAPAARVARTTERVLVVDDNEDARNLLADAVIALGYTVTTASDGPSALTIAEEFSPAIAILDIGLPVMDGYELAGHLRGRGRVRRLIAVTGYGQDSDRLRAREAGFDAHLVKPVALDDLAKALVAADEQRPS